MALSAAMDRRIEGSRQRSDFGELAQRALVGAVTEHLQRRMPTLLGSTSDDVSGANECLSYFLSKTLPAQVGEERRFATMGQLAGFEEAMRTHCSEAAEIVETYSGGWFSKELHQEGKISRRDQRPR